MKIAEIVSFLETLAHPSLQESYDNAGLLTGDGSKECTGVICSLDATEDVVEEAIAKNCNLIVAHHPIIFKGLRTITGRNYVERTIISAIKKDIAIYAIHTNLDNVIDGVSGRMAQLLGLKNTSVLLPKENQFKKLFTFVPVEHADKVRASIFAAGAGQIGNYSECSFNAEGWGTFRANEGASPFVGETGSQHRENEIRIEVIFPSYLERMVIEALSSAHPYEEPAFDIINLANTNRGTGSGLIGDLDAAVNEKDFVTNVKLTFGVPFCRHSRLLETSVKRVAICGGAGSFLISKAIAAGAQAFITADLKYHEFFDADGRIILMDIGHYESEQFTIDLLEEKIAQKFPTFAVLKSAVRTNPVHYS